MPKAKRNPHQGEFGPYITTQGRSGPPTRGVGGYSEAEWRAPLSGKNHRDNRSEALQTAISWDARDTVWTGGSRVDSGGVGVECAWQASEGWTTNSHLG